MGVSALYAGGKRDPARFYTLNLSPFSRRNGCEAPINLRVTARAVAVAGGTSRAYELLPAGIRRENDIFSLPHIFLRTAKDRGMDSIRLLLSEDELAAVGRQFGIKLAAAEGSMFVRDKSAWNSHQVALAPDWPSLLNPTWRGNYLAWLHDPANQALPKPDRLPWQTLPDDSMELPGLSLKVYFANGRKTVNGELRLVPVDGRARLDFVVRENLLHSVLVERSPAGLTAKCLRLGEREVPVTAETFDGIRLASLFGPRAAPGREEYCFSRLAGSGCFRFSPHLLKAGRISNRLAALILRSSTALPVAAGTLGHFRIVRENNIINIAYHRDKAMTKLVGWAQYYLDVDGLPRSNECALRAPSAEMPACLRLGIEK